MNIIINSINMNIIINYIDKKEFELKSRYFYIFEIIFLKEKKRGGSSQTQNIYKSQNKFASN